MSDTQNECATKKMKSDDSERMAQTVHRNDDISLSMFAFKRVLNQNSNSKMIVIEAEHQTQTAILVMEKTAISEDNARRMLSETKGGMKCDFHNDIYGTYAAFVSPDLNAINTTIIHPATDQHIRKYSSQSIYIALETPETYAAITEPHIERQQFSLDWVRNILEHKSESDRIVFEDSDPELGFVLLPDMKWDTKQVSNLYLVAVVRKAGIRSLRDLRSEHLSLLRNIKTKGCEVICEKYGIGCSSVRIYIHYQPSYYHFHVHFTALTYESSGAYVERAHLIDTVINNISLCSDYYQKSTLAFPLKQNDALYSEFTKAGLIQA